MWVIYIYIYINKVKSTYIRGVKNENSCCLEYLFILSILVPWIKINQIMVDYSSFSVFLKLIENNIQVLELYHNQNLRNFPASLWPKDCALGSTYIIATHFPGNWPNASACTCPTSYNLYPYLSFTFSK